MIADLARMIRKTRTPRIFVSGFECVKESLQRRLGIHDNVFAAGQLHHQIGTQSTALGSNGLLLSKVAVRKHARDFDHPP